MYIIRLMRVWVGTGPSLAVALLLAAACGNPLGRQYEYEEQFYLAIDGSATIILNASVPALVALRGVPIDPAPSARTDRDDVRRLFESGGCDVVRVGQPWRRRGRRFVQVRLRTADVRTLGACKWLGWSTVQLENVGEMVHYRHIVGPPAGADPGTPKWEGSEIVAFKLHLPSRILDHNFKLLADGSNAEVERGNILTSEQRLADRLSGKPIEMDVTMGAESILYQTLGLFAGAFLAAVALLTTIVWLVVSKGRRQKATKYVARTGL